ncbi:MAG: DUF4349 domain-containing protein [Burkholderiales bacterium]|nr:MAG: DUF4349 domain-containing protein [Burkholderiales bacterium]
MVRLSLAAVLALTLAACGQNPNSEAEYARVENTAAMAPMPMAPPAPPMESAKMDMASGGGSPADRQIIQPDPDGGGGGQPAGQRLIAYTYNYGFKVPAAGMQGLLDAHKKQCEDAGPSKCYVVGSSISGLGDDQSYGQMTIRGSADWVKTFRAGMVDGLKPFNATLDSNSDSAEDLTVNIVDSEARLRSLKTMRDRLEQLLRDRPGKLGDLLEIEREYARVQGEIDSSESILAQMKLRVAMSVMTLNYTASYPPGSESVWRPVGDAFGGFEASFAGAFAAIVRFVAEILPVVIIGGLAVWGVIGVLRWRGRRNKKPVAAPATTVKPSSGP